MDLFCLLFVCCLTPPGQKAASRGALGVLATTYRQLANQKVLRRGKFNPKSSRIRPPQFESVLGMKGKVHLPLYGVLVIKTISSPFLPTNNPPFEAFLFRNFGALSSDFALEIGRSGFLACLEHSD